MRAWQTSHERKQNIARLKNSLRKVVHGRAWISHVVLGIFNFEKLQRHQRKHKNKKFLFVCIIYPGDPIKFKV